MCLRACLCMNVQLNTRAAALKRPITVPPLRSMSSGEGSWNHDWHLNCWHLKHTRSSKIHTRTNAHKNTRTHYHPHAHTLAGASMQELLSLHPMQLLMESFCCPLRASAGRRADARTHMQPPAASAIRIHRAGSSASVLTSGRKGAAAC